MKFTVLLLALLFAAVNISKPSSERELNHFNPETLVISLNDVADSSQDERDGETETQTYEVEETELFSSFIPLHFEVSFRDLSILGILKVFISSYSFSIFIPPLS